MPDSPNPPRPRLTTPILSIITPSFNQAPYLRQTLESVAGQPVPPGAVEHIVIDGGSTDGSVEIIRQFGPRLAYWVSEEDRGQSDAINKGLARARGRFATWLNSDDWYEPGVLAEVVERLTVADGPDGFDVLVGRCKFIAEGGAVVFAPRPPEPVNVANLLRLKSQWFNGRLIVQPEAFFRLAPVMALGGLNLDNHYSMDHELWVRLALGGARFSAFDRHVANLRVHAGQKTSSNREVVRCLIRFARPLAEQAGPAMGPDAAEVKAEIESMARKLALADPVFERWKPAPAGPEREEWSAAAEYLDAVDEHEEAWNHQRRELHAPRVQVGLASVAAGSRAGLIRPWRVLVLSTDSGQAAMHVLDRFPMRRIDLTACTAGEAQHRRMLARFGLDPVAGMRRGFRRSVCALRADAGGLVQALSAGPFDFVLIETALVCAQRPAAVLETLWRSLRPGGLLLQAGEPIADGSVERYVQSLTVRLSRQLSINDELVLGVMTDYFLPRIGVEGALTLPSGGPSLWHAAHPGARGVPVEAIMGALSPRPEPLLRRRYGAMDYLPLTPFPTVEQVTPPGDGWLMTLWRKPA